MSVGHKPCHDGHEKRDISGALEHRSEDTHGGGRFISSIVARPVATSAEGKGRENLALDVWWFPLEAPARTAPAPARSTLTAADQTFCWIVVGRTQAPKR